MNPQTTFLLLLGVALVARMKREGASMPVLRNMDAFVDANGVVHPIRASDGYDSEKAGEDIGDKRYWDKRKTRFEAEDREAAQYAKTDQAKIEKLQRKLTGLEADRDAHSDAERQTVRDQIEAIRQTRQAREDSEWTAKTTAARRAAWNAAVQSAKYRSGKTVLVAKIEKDLGFALDDLKRAVQRLGGSP